MNKIKINGLLGIFALLAAMVIAPVVQAFEYSVQGFIRQEMAYKYTNDENQMNRGGSKFNGHTGSLPAGGLPFAFFGLAGLTSVIDGELIGTVPQDLITKADDSKDNDWNVFGTKAEVDINFTFNSNLGGFIKLRGYYMWDVFSNNADSSATDGEGGNKINQFNMNVHGKEATYLSFSDNEYMLDIPAMYLDWTIGKLWLRIGQQQIAWGEALFFRVQDVANGLDLRRHVFFDMGAEEYADERLASPGIRASYVINRNWEVEVFAQMFQPTILPTNNSPYNPVANGFNPDYKEGYDNVQNNFNGGIRLSGQFDQLGVQLFAVARHDPNPIFNLRAGGDVASGALFVANPGGTFASQPFVYQSGGYGAGSAEEWFYLSQVSGIDGVSVLNNLIDDYSFITDIVANQLGMVKDPNGEWLNTIAAGNSFGLNTVGGLLPDGMSATDFLAAFYAAPLTGFLADADGTLKYTLTGNIVAHYASENVFGFGLNYIFYSEPDTLLDQMVVRFEASMTPDKKFTNNLSNNFIEEDEFLVSVVIEKYHRFSNSFPATFFIVEWMYRSESDLLGRHLSGIGGDANSRPGGGEDGRGWHGFVFAFQQPSPTLLWRFDFSMLYDELGGIFLQPAVRYKPNNKWIVEAFVNIIDGNTDSVFQPFDYSDDITVRLTYQF